MTACLSFLYSPRGKLYGRLIRQLVEGGVGTRRYENIHKIECSTETDYVYLRSYRHLKSHNPCTMVSPSLKILPRHYFTFSTLKSQILHGLKPSHLIQKIGARKFHGFEFRAAPIKTQRYSRMPKALGREHLPFRSTAH